MPRELTRKDFLRTSVFGTVGLFLLSPTSVFASDRPESIDASMYLPNIPASRNTAVNQENQSELAKWESSVKKAFAFDDDINMNHSNHEPVTGNNRYNVCTRKVTTYNIPCEIAFDAVFETLPDGTIGEVYVINSGETAWGPTVKLVQSSWVKEDHGKKLAAFYVVDVTWDPGIYPKTIETYGFYQEFRV